MGLCCAWDQCVQLYLSFSMWGLLTHQGISLPPLCFLRGDKRKVEPCLGTNSCLHMYSLHCDHTDLGGGGHRPRAPRKHSLGQALTFLNFRGSCRKEGSRAFPRPFYPTSTPVSSDSFASQAGSRTEGMAFSPGIWVRHALPSLWVEVWGPHGLPCPAQCQVGLELCKVTLSLHSLACWDRSKCVCR